MRPLAALPILVPLLLACSACLWSAPERPTEPIRSLEDLAAARAMDLVVLARRSEPAPGARPSPPPAELAAPASGWSAETRQTWTGQESTTWRIRLAGPGGEERVIEAVVNLQDLAWSPDGSKLAVCEGAIVRIENRDDGLFELLEIGAGGPYPGACFDLAWSPDGATLSFTRVAHAGQPDLGDPERVQLTLGRVRRDGEGAAGP